MSALCSCDVSLQNLGTPNCTPIMDVTQQFILVPLIANDGTRNKIATTDTLDAAYVTAKLNQSDDSKRWYPTGELTNVGGERAEPIYETFDNGKQIFIRQGARNVTALLVKGTPELLKQINSNRCGTFGVYVIDVNGSATGYAEDGDDVNLYPIPVDAASWNGKFVWTDDKQIQKIMLAFQWAIGAKDENLRSISASAFTGVNLADVRGLINAYITIVSTGQTAMVVDIFNRYGNFMTNTPVFGLLVTDFVSSVTATTSKIRNTTDAADITITTVTESTTVDGRYTLAYASQTVADVMQPLIKKNGLDAIGMVGTVGTVV